MAAPISERVHPPTGAMDKCITNPSKSDADIYAFSLIRDSLFLVEMEFIKRYDLVASVSHAFRWSPCEACKPEKSTLKSYKRLFGSALLFTAILTAVALWIVQLGGVPTTTDRVAQGGALRVGFAVEEPYAFYDRHGQVTGEAPEIFRIMARRMGIERIEWVRLDFANLLPELQLGRIDAIAAGMFITPDRELEAAFTLPTARVRPAIVVRKGEARIALRPTLNDLGRTSAFRWSTVHGAAENQALLQAGVPSPQIRTVPQAQRGLRMVAESDADAFAISAVTAATLVSQNPQWALDMRTVVDGPAGLPAFAFRTTDTSMRDAMNLALLEFLGSDQHTSLVNRFGFTKDELPPKSH